MVEDQNQFFEDDTLERVQMTQQAYMEFVADSEEIPDIGTQDWNDIVAEMVYVERLRAEVAFEVDS